MMIDLALDAERNEGKTPHDETYQACLLRFRPILMTAMAAVFGALLLTMGPRRFGASPSARHFHRRRPAGRPGAHTVHDARDLSMARPAAA
jgi:hypothetical protein